jgi:DNA-binding transcriptional regulator YdaS (Cro superfamily)
MEKLLQYINSLPPGERDLFAGRCGTSENYLRKACSVGQLLGPALCVSIERASGGQVRRADLRSDWPLIWPELGTAA